MSEHNGCSSHACLVAKPQGMGTNSNKCYCPEWKIRAVVDNLRADVAALRDLLNIYNVGGWTDALAPMQRALKAEAEIARLTGERDALREKVRGWATALNEQPLTVSQQRIIRLMCEAPMTDALHRCEDELLQVTKAYAQCAEQRDTALRQLAAEQVAHEQSIQMWVTKYADLIVERNEFREQLAASNALVERARPYAKWGMDEEKKVLEAVLKEHGENDVTRQLRHDIARSTVLLSDMDAALEADHGK